MLNIIKIAFNIGAYAAGIACLLWAGWMEVFLLRTRNIDVTTNLFMHSFCCTVLFYGVLCFFSTGRKLHKNLPPLVLPLSISMTGLFMFMMMILLWIGIGCPGGKAYSSTSERVWMITCSSVPLWGPISKWLCYLNKKREPSAKATT